MKEEWIEMPHPIFGVGGKEPWTPGTTGRFTFPTTIWRKGKYSIIPPSDVSHNLWEIYDGNDIERFDTLQEAQESILHTHN